MAVLAHPAIGLVLLLSAAGAVVGDPRSEAVARAARTLWTQQGEDGGWHSATYGLLRSGQSLTPFVLSALLEVPEEIAAPPPGAVQRAIAFLLEGMDENGALGCRDPMLLDYPNYASALGARVLWRVGQRDAAGHVRAYLVGQQLTEPLGWAAGDAAYGAWGMGGPPRRAPHTGRVDLSLTRHVLEALREIGPPQGSGAFAGAERFLERCRGEDGGFFLSPVHLEINKAGIPPAGRPRSYGTATADAILALRALGIPADDPRLAAAAAWLVSRHRCDEVPGIPPDDDAGWAKAMHLYYLAASAQAFRGLGVIEAPQGRDWRGDLVDALVRLQRPDGTWRNGSFLMKEDDPLVATTLALIALLAAA